MLNTKLGLFYVHQFAPDINVISKFIYEIVEVYLLNEYGCLSHIVIMLFGGLYCDSLATRELAAVLASKWMQENLPLTAKLSQYMKQVTQGTKYVPSFRANGTDLNTLQERYFRELQKDCAINSASDAYYVSAIACFCLTFLFPPAVIGAVICVYRAKKCQKGGKA
jgi:hypothetical protein